MQQAKQQQAKAEVIIKNPMGLHTRPATEIVKLLQDFKSNVSLVYNEKVANARSILGILVLGARRNAPITVVAEGPDAEEVIAKMVSAFSNGNGIGL